DQDHARRIMRAGLKDANARMDGLADALVSWGVTPGEWKEVPIGEKMRIAEELTSIPSLQAFTAELGRHREAALWAVKQPGAYDPQEAIGVTTGSDPGLLLESELAFLADPDLEDLVYLALAQEEALVYEFSGRTPSGLGPFIVLTDISGSMEGQKERWAKAFIIAAIWLAAREKR